MSNHFVVSRRNGLKITLPNTPQTSNLLQRFHLRGENELVFEQKTKPTQDVFLGEVATKDAATSNEGGAASVDDVI